MENYIVINGKKAELAPEQLKALGLEREIKNPFKRVNRSENFYAIGGTGNLDNCIDYKSSVDDRFFKIANYCTDKELMQQRAYTETLNRLLWRYSMEHKGNEINWSNVWTKSYIVYYDKANNDWFVDHTYCIYPVGSVGFYSREIAEAAIKEIIEPFMAEHPDFKL